MLVERRNDGLVVELVLLGDQSMRCRHQPLKAGKRIGAQLIPGLGCRDVRRATHFKPFVEVGRNYAQIAQALKQRNVFALGPAQYPLVEDENILITV